MHSMTVGEAAQSRRSVRQYTDAPVRDEDLREILLTMGLAPSAWNLQPWRVIAVRDATLRQRLMDAARGQKQVGRAPVVLVLYSDMQDTLDHLDETLHPETPADRRQPSIDSVRRNFAARTLAEVEQHGLTQSYIALGYLLLAAQSRGYATSPMMGFDAAKVKEVLGLPAHVGVAALIAMGVANESGRPHHRHAFERFVTVR